MNKVILSMDGGFISAVNIPENTEVIIHDYDSIVGVDPELIQTDKNGQGFIEVILDR